MKRFLLTNLILVLAIGMVISQEKSQNNGLNSKDIETLDYFDFNTPHSPCLDIFRKYLVQLESEETNKKLIEDQKALYNKLNRLNPNQMYLLDSTYSYEWGDLFRVWDPTSNSKYTYDENGFQTTLLSQLWNDGTNSWVNNLRFVYTYNSSDLLLRSVWQSWNSNAAVWEDNYQYEYSYDNSSNMTQLIYFIWDPTFNMWIQLEKNIYTYDGNNNMLSWTIQHWDDENSGWENYTKRTFTYDGNNNLSIELYQTWITSEIEWRNSLQISYTYDNNNYLTEEILQLWGAGISNWQNFRRQLYMYDNNGNETEHIFQDWSTSTSTWINDRQQLLSYNNGLLIEVIEKDWSTVSNAWFNLNKTNIIWDANENEQYEIYFVWNSQTLLWDYSTKLDFYYSLHQITEVTETSNLSHSTYPNPFTNIINIEYSLGQSGHVEISIYNARGMLVERLVNTGQSAGSYNMQWKAQCNSSGIYFYRIKTSAGIQTGKLLLKN